MAAAQEHGAGAMSRQHWLCERSSARRVKIFIARNSNRYIIYRSSRSAAILDYQSLAVRNVPVVGASRCQS